MNHETATLGLLAGVLSKVAKKSTSSKKIYFNAALDELLEGLEFFSTAEDDNSSAVEVYKRHFNNLRSVKELLKELEEEINLM